MKNLLPRSFLIKIAMTIEQQIESKVKEVTLSQWGCPITFTPFLADAILGDGQRLAFICPINSRPYYWLMGRWYMGILRRLKK